MIKATPIDPTKVIIVYRSKSENAHRRMDKKWARKLLAAARRHDAAFFFKQGSGIKPGMDNTLDGLVFHEMPIQKHDEWFWWDCPHCGTGNFDNLRQTSVPMCESCGKEFDWVDITSVNSRRLAALSRKIEHGWRG